MKTNKFLLNLTSNHKGIINKRASFIAEDAKEEFNNEIMLQKRKVRSLEKEIMSLEDLAPDNTQSLLPTNGDFKAKEWVKRLITCKTELELVNRELNIMLTTYEEFFGEIEVDTKS